MNPKNDSSEEMKEILGEGDGLKDSQGFIHLRGSWWDIPRLLAGLCVQERGRCDGRTYVERSVTATVY
jgi:hypothetical protein